MPLPPLNPNIANTVTQVSKDPKIQKGFVNLGDPSINTNTELPPGLEKVIAIIARFVISAQSSTIALLYGKYAKQNSLNPITKALDKGILNLLNDVAEIDFCNIINYLISQVPAGEKFNPENPPTGANRLEVAKWTLQKSAFDVQTFIDKYYTSYADEINSRSKEALYELIQDIQQAFQVVTSPNGLINDPELRSLYPDLSNASTFLEDTLGFFNQYTDFRQIPNEDLQKVISLIDKVKFYCIAIQGLNSPATVLNFADSLFGGGIQEQIAKLNRIIAPTKLIPLLRNILKTANNINSVATKMLQFINVTRVIIKILILIIKAYNIIIIFFNTNPIPAMFGTKGTNQLEIDLVQNKIKDIGKKKSIKRLRQIDAVLSVIAGFVSVLIAGMYSIMLKLEVILLNLESCNNVDPELKQDIQNTINNLAANANSLQNFLDKYRQADSERLKTFGEYTIEIITEQTVDEGINLKRRYGIALDSNNYIVAQSTPTFASLDLIIVNEVKLILASKGLVKLGSFNLDAEEAVAISDAIRFLDDQDITLENIQFNSDDIQTVTSSDEGIGLQSFINNLPGGKALRKRVRKAFADHTSSFGSNLKATDPNSKFTSNIPE